MKTIYICTDTVTGIFSGIYDAWKAEGEEDTCGIALRGALEQQLFCDYVETVETEHKAVVVEAMIKKNLGRPAYWDIYHAALAADGGKGDAILGTMLAARRIREKTMISELMLLKLATSVASRESYSLGSITRVIVVWMLEKNEVSTVPISST